MSSPPRSLCRQRGDANLASPRPSCSLPVAICRRPAQLVRLVARYPVSSVQPRALCRHQQRPQALLIRRGTFGRERMGVVQWDLYSVRRRDYGVHLQGRHGLVCRRQSERAAAHRHSPSHRCRLSMRCCIPLWPFATKACKNADCGRAPADMHCRNRLGINDER